MKRVMKIIGILLAVLLVVGGLSAAAYFSFSKGKKPEKEETAKVQRGELAVSVAETGNVEAMRQVNVKSKVAGEVSHVFVDVGDRIRKGQKLIQLDTTDMERERAQVTADLEMAQAALKLMLAGARPEEIVEAKAQLEQATAAHTRAKAEYDRSQGALATKTITVRDAESVRSEYISAQGQLTAAKARLSKMQAGYRAEEITETRARLKKAEIALKVAEDQLAYATIKAPMDGTVIYRGIEPGEMVSPGVSATAQGTSMLTIAELDNLLIRSELNQIDIGKVQKGQRVEVWVDALPGKTFQGTVHKVAPAAFGEADKKTFAVETLVDQGPDAAQLKPGMTADLNIQVVRKANALFLPIEAVVREKGTKATVTLPTKDTDGKPRTKDIKVGLSNDHQIEVAEGLNEGQEVLIKPPASDATAKR